MKAETLDFLFPFLVFFYGTIMALVIEIGLENKALAKIAQERMPALGATLRGHRNLAWVCLFVGGLWSLQNLWAGTH